MESLASTLRFGGFALENPKRVYLLYGENGQIGKLIDWYQEIPSSGHYDLHVLARPLLQPQNLSKVIILLLSQLGRGPMYFCICQCAYFFALL
jgi:hypothetical protein